MIIVGRDYHPSFQQIAFVDTETGELKEQRLSGDFERYGDFSTTTRNSCAKSTIVSCADCRTIHRHEGQEAYSQTWSTKGVAHHRDHRNCKMPA